MAALVSANGGRAFETSHGDMGTDQEQWDFSIPTAEERQYWERQKGSHVSGGPDQVQAANMLDRDRAGNNGTPKSSRSMQKVDPAFLSPYKGALKLDLVGSRSGSEADSLLDLYGHPRSLAERSMDSPQVRPDVPGPTDDVPSRNDDDSEQSRWIHRDKLAAIESQEMQAAGIVPPAPPRGSGRSKSRRGLSQDRRLLASRDHGQEAEIGQQATRGEIQSPPSEDEAQEYTLDREFDIRTSDEIARDKATHDSLGSPLYRQQGLRSSSSRIPLPRSSPLPLPQEHIERTTPLPRNRAASGNWSGGDEDGISYSRLRSRNNSIGSQVLLDDIDGTHYTPSRSMNSRPNSSGSLSRMTSKTPSKMPNSRKPSLSSPSSAQKPRQGSRPKSRSGLEPRPATAINRPDGDAPWLKDMYKPDPRLPPDQQLLPTHAKRLQEEQARREQWEQAQRDSEDRKRYGGSSDRRQQQQHSIDDPQDGSYAEQSINASPSIGLGRTRDRNQDFSPLAEYTQNGLQPPTPSGSRDGIDDASRNHPTRDPNASWPLARSTVRPAPPLSVINSESGGPSIHAGNAGYSAMPKMRGQQQQSTAEIPHDASSSAQTEGVGDLNGLSKPMDPFDRERMERAKENAGDEENDKKKAKKFAGCKCCIVM